jgi:hypothetical protein
MIRFTDAEAAKSKEAAKKGGDKEAKRAPAPEPEPAAVDDSPRAAPKAGAAKRKKNFGG